MLSDKQMDKAIETNRRIYPSRSHLIPELIFDKYPMLALNPGGNSAAKIFSNEVAVFQKHHKVKVTGILDDRTLFEMNKTTPYGTQCRIVFPTPRIKVNDDYEYLYHQADLFHGSFHLCGQETFYGANYEIQQTNPRKFSDRTGKKISLIVLHWGGNNVDNLFQYMNRTSRQVSTHFAVGYSENFVPVIAQYLDIKYRAFHAGYVNNYSIGIDIAQQPLPRWLDDYTDVGYDVHLEDNKTDRGRKQILTVDPITAKDTCKLVQELCAHFKIPYKFPRGKDGLQDVGEIWHGTFDRKILDSGQFQGVIGHHHMAKTKWDIACWWEDIFGV